MDFMNEEQPPSGNKSSWLDKLSNLLNDENVIEDIGELHEAIEIARSGGIIKDDTAEMIRGVLDMSLSQVGDVMVPRCHMEVIEEHASIESIIELIKESGHSRYPVISEDYEQVVGMLIVKDLLPFVLRGNLNVSIQEVMRKIAIVPESKRLDSLLRDFRLNRQHMAVVIDEYGNLSGLITIEDILEEIVGEIDDEHDEIEVAPIRPLGNGQFVVNALTTIEDFNDYFSTDISDDDVDTIGGYVTMSLGRLPEVGETVHIKRLQFKILKADQRRIISLNVQRV